MTKVKVFPGPCAFEATITASGDEKYQVKIEVESKCPAVKAVAKKLETITLQDVVGKGGFGNLRPFKEATGVLAHATCPVFTAILKAAEAEMGLAVPRDVTIEFIKDE